MGDIWERKMKTFFRRMDLDKDGVIRQKDFEVMAERFRDPEKIDPVLEESVKQCFNGLFSYLTKSSGSTDDCLLTEEMLIESVRPQRNDPGFKKFLSDASHTMLPAMDGDQDGYVDFVEYRRIFENIGIIESDFTKEGFNAIDVDQDGKLSFDEFITAAHDYFSSDNENSTALFGLLV